MYYLTISVQKWCTAMQTKPSRQQFILFLSGWGGAMVYYGHQTEKYKISIAITTFE